ncbi:putative disease resistance protein At1g50180 [Arachis ipaensis]|uniref:putative disease resistance protein At1g50180 n=1 Tax=Arachis ipaensis TaxID=130454 RepID=UPI000A2B00AA|nr:putative disease resistance protein At1g50180 [Arachis ipaensis]
MSIVVLCQNYASSSWCLDELVQIMKCSDKGTKRPVLPVFYQVEPSDVRHQRNQYEKDMMSHENRYCNDLNKVKEWRLALYEVCGLSGKHCAENSYESDVIMNIVEEVSAKVPPEPLYIKHPIDFGSQFEVVESLLDTKSHDTLCMLILYGDVETKKSTFAGELYNKIKHQFQAASFLDKVRIKSRGIPNSLENLQETLLSGMCVHKKPRIGSTLKGSSDIKQSLHNKRVLLVLDDVDSIEQLDSLAGGSDWFGLGSRIIITTRDVNVLDKYELNGVKVMKYCIDEGEFKSMEGAKSNHEQDKDLQEDIVGFVEIFNEIVEKLKENESCTEVVSIIGMGGLGKTTLARKIYNNNKVKKLFSCCGWVTISKDYKAKDVLTSLVNGWGLSKSTTEYKVLSEKEQKSKVQEHLDRNKYLIVLDDLWEPEVWDEVESLFPNNKSGNTILITSRNDEVANYTRSKSYYPPFLDKNESWKLFCKVFGTQQCPPVLEMSIVTKMETFQCGFLPLAIVTLAGIVVKKKRLTVEWMRIMRNVIWYLAKDNNGVMNVLKLSYDNLLQRLKPCFLYFAVFPEDYRIPVKQLIQLWIAKGLIQPPKSGTSSAGKLEDMAKEYLNELVDRSFVLVARKRSNGSLSVCRIHDLLRDLCISESKADNEFEICTEKDIHSMDMKKFCRLSLRSPEFDDWRSFTNQ